MASILKPPGTCAQKIRRLGRSSQDSTRQLPDTGVESLSSVSFLQGSLALLAAAGGLGM
jgi:hypothetical protein